MRHAPIERDAAEAGAAAPHLRGPERRGRGAGRPLLPLTVPLMLALLLLLGGAAGSAFAHPFSDIYFIGDSQTDGGNAYVLTGGTTAAPPFAPVPALPYDSGTLSNGMVWSQYLTAALGLPGGPSLLGGTNYAIGGARVATDSTSLTTQTASLLSDLGGALPPEALFAVWGGGNDVRDAIAAYPADPVAAGQIISDAVGALDGILRDLAAAGAEHLLVMSLGDTGLAPAANPPLSPAGTAALATQLTELFNDELDLVLTNLLLDVPGLDLITFDVFEFSQRVTGNPSAYGLTDTTDACLNFGESDPALAYCSDPDGYFFWDAVHSTTAVHALLAEEVRAAVPAPAPWAVLLLAPVLPWLRGRKSARGSVGPAPGLIPGPA